MQICTMHLRTCTILCFQRLFCKGVIILQCDLRNISVFVLELRRFSKLEFRNSVSLRAHLYGKFIEAYKYIVYCSYVLACSKI